MSNWACGRIYVWDSFVRVFHWTLVLAFAIAFVTEDDALRIHVWAGYIVGILVVARVIWGLVGSKYARFADFTYRPRAVVRYVCDLILFRAKRHIGHSPGGGAMVLVFLLSLAVTVASGLVVYGAGEGAGPLASFFASASIEAPSQQPALSDDDARDDDESRRESTGKGKGEESPLVEATKELHEFFANLTLALVIAHIGAVALASFAHRENLVRAMVSGYKRP